MDVNVIRRYRKKEGQTNVYSYSTVNTGGGGGATYVPTPPAIIPFTLTQTPGILNYQTNYASLYGQHPRLSLFTFDENDDMIERMETPKRSIVNDVIDSITWDLGIEDSGIIVLYPTA